MDLTLRRKLGAALAAVGVGWLIVIVAWRPAPFALSFDDAYYYFTIGRNWADGHASTFGLIDRTNGYHPLWQLLCIVPFELGLSGTTAVRSLLVFQLVAWLATWSLMLTRVCEAIDGWPRLADRPRATRWCDGVVIVVAVAIAANPFVFKMIVNGLESGLVVPVGAALLWWTIGFRGRFASKATVTQRLVTGGLLAVAVMSRTDALLLVGIVVVACLLDSGTRARPSTLPTRISAAAQVAIIPAVVTGAYLVFNHLVFDTALQISGSVKRLPLTGGRVMATAVWALVCIGVLVVSRRPVPSTSKARRVRRFFSATGWYGTFCLALVGYYTTLQAVPYLWYFAPIALYGTWLALLFAADLCEGAAADAPFTSKAASLSLPARIPALVIALPLVVGCGLSLRGMGDPHARSLMEHDAHTGVWIDENLPPNAVVASWDAGVIGFFAHRPMVNLDGVVNTVEWSEAKQEGRTAAFLAERNVGWVANHGTYRNGAEPGIASILQRYFGPAADQFTVVHIERYAYSGSLDGSRTDRSTKAMATYVYRLGG